MEVLHMKLKWYGTATLFIESAGTRILIDPYFRRNTKIPLLPLEEAATADAVFITHPHLDHFMDAEAFLEAGIPACYVSRGGIKRCAERGEPTGKLLPYKAGDSIAVGNLTVTAYEGRHCVFDAGTLARIVLSPRTYLMLPRAVKLLRCMRIYKIEDDDIFVLEISDGKKSVTVLGSAGMADGADYPTGSDMLVFPYQGRTKMHKYMQPFLQRFSPKAVLADHFDNAFPPFSHSVNMKKFAPAVKNVLPSARAIVPKENEWIEV